MPSDLKPNEPCPDCGRYQNRALTIDAVMVRDGKILLIKRAAKPYKDFWALPGGYVEQNETVEDAVRREVTEETGLAVKNLKLIGLFSSPSRHPKQAVSAAYTVEVDGEVVVGDDATEFQWAPLTELPPLAFDHGEIIETYRREIK
ncbi:MAG: NUDIX hydrolase [Patescibacteria group bacterium]|nr:NUDIX hydrolase [Patescibacteria group bacterium]